MHPRNADCRVEKLPAGNECEGTCTHTDEFDAHEYPAEISGYEEKVENILPSTEEEINELRIPRISRTLFDRYLEGFGDNDYLYRVDFVDSAKVGRIGLSDLREHGHRYINPCDNISKSIEKYRNLGNDVALLLDVMNEVKNHLGESSGGGLYCYLKLKDAVRQQHIQAGLAVNATNMNDLRAKIAIITRYKRSASRGQLLPDPLTFGGASAALQIAQYEDGIISTVRPNNIEIWYDNNWQTIDNFCPKNLLSDIASGNIEKLMYPCKSVEL